MIEQHITLLLISFSLLLTLLVCKTSSSYLFAKLNAYADNHQIYSSNLDHLHWKNAFVKKFMSQISGIKTMV